MWKKDVEKWRSLSGKVLPEGVQITVLLENAPSGIRSQLALAGHTTSAAIDQNIAIYLGVTRFLGPSVGRAPDAMEVDAIGKGEGQITGKGDNAGQGQGTAGGPAPRSATGRTASTV